MDSAERRQRVGEEVRTKILDAAREMFAAFGYEAVTMRKIADRIEYSPTAIYFHFRDKTALIRELCEHDFLNFAHRLSRLAKVTDPIERLNRIGRAYVDFGLSHPNHYRLMFMSPPVAIEDVSHYEQRGNPEHDAYAFLQGTVYQAIAEGRLRPDLDADLVAQLFWSGMHGIVSLHLAKASEGWVPWRPFKQRTEAMLELLVGGVLAEAQQVTEARDVEPQSTREPKVARASGARARGHGR